MLQVTVKFTFNNNNNWRNWTQEQVRDVTRAMLRANIEFKILTDELSIYIEEIPEETETL